MIIEIKLKHVLILLVVVIASVYLYTLLENDPTDNNSTTTFPGAPTTTLPEEKPEIEKLVECSYDFRDFNSDILVSDDGSIYTVNRNTIQRFQVVDGACSHQWGIIFQSDNQQIVSDGKYLWVSSRSHNAVGKIKLSGQTVSFKAVSATLPMGLELKDGSLYVAEFQGSVKRYSKSSATPTLTIKQTGYIFDVAADSKKNIYVILNDERSMRGGDRILKFDSKGELLEENYLQTNIANSIRIDKKDNLYITDSDTEDSQGYVPNIIKKYSPEKELTDSWKTEGRITAFTVFEDKLFIASLDGTKSRLSCYNTET